jgi:hypothetical protein
VVPVGKSFNSYDLLSEKPPEGSSGTSFWGSTKGKIIIGVIIALVIIGAVVGGAVGGTVGKKKSSSIAVSTSQSPTAAAQPVASGSSTATATFTGIPSISITVPPSNTDSATRPSISFIAPGQNVDEKLGELANNQAIG